MDKKIEILVGEHGELTVNNYNMETEEMVNVLFSIVLGHAKGNFQENFFPLGNDGEG